MTRNAQDIIDDIRNIVKPKIAKMLLEANFEGRGKEDKAEFETEFEIILTLAEKALEQEPRWIPVSEYLPVTNDEVLVTYIVNGNAKKRYVETANCFDGEWSSVNDEYRIPNTKIEIIAWCEMPKPYKAESEET